MVRQYVVTIYGMFRVLGHCFLKEKLFRLNMKTKVNNTSVFIFSLNGV